MLFDEEEDDIPLVQQNKIDKLKVESNYENTWSEVTCLMCGESGYYEKICKGPPTLGCMKKKKKQVLRKKKKN